MKVRDTITIDRETNAASTGYDTFLVKLEGLALRDVSYTPAPSGLIGAPGTKHFTFQAVKAGRAEVQFARFRPWLVPAEVLYEDVLTIDVEAADADEAGGVEAAANIKPGGWTPFAKVSADTQKVFDEAVKDLLGVGYTPLAVTSQVVNGTNYIFAANAKVVYPDSREYSTLVRVFRPPNGQPRVVKFHALGSPRALVGGVGPFREASDKDNATVQTALKGHAGSGYEAVLTSVQVVAGLNYRFIGTQTLVDAQADKYPVLFTVYQPPAGLPVFTGSQKIYDVV